MLYLILGLVVFLGVHSVRIFAPAWAEARKASMGEGPWKGLYSATSLIGFVLLVWGFGQARWTAPVLWAPPFWVGHITALLMLFAMIALAAYMLPAGRIKAALKHPMLVAVKIWAFAHLLINGDLASVILFGSFLAWAVLDRISLKRRAAPTPVAGPATWDVATIVLGLVLYGLFVWKLHFWLFGVVPLTTG
ncbi:NnrU family protein [Zhengella mangrovi]|uniref:NnrU family protein n=1 Tax=Zhengella mangrovi TaxID=1982044 RepID=A0A2G1QNF9_9HYPH|nr:NnrU family protein [Zhengella mangrovi]PHP67063.1 NnrU family protein [Zhengella mangrovi]